MKIDLALREVHAAETALARALRCVGERHRMEHDVFHVSKTLSGWCDRNVRRLAAEGERYRVDLDARSADDPGERSLPAGGAELVGPRPDPGVLLLRDLRDVYLAAARASIAWTVLGQGAQAVHDDELLATVTTSHPETIRTLKWTVQKLKEASPQVLAS